MNTPQPSQQPSTRPRPYAVLARRAVRQMVAAKLAGDEQSADQFSRLAAEFVDLHLEQRRRLP